MKYPRSVSAARGVGLGRKELAEALLTEIPPRRGRPPRGQASVEDLLVEAAAEILDETGETYAPGTLRNYRNVAAWVAGNEHVHVSIPWADASWTAHMEAYEKGLTWEEFSQGRRTKRAVREQAGALTGDVPAAARAINVNPDEAAHLVQGLSDQATEAVREALMNKDLESVGLRPLQPRQTPADPTPRWHRLTLDIAGDIRLVLTDIADLHTNGQHNVAEQALRELRDVLIEGVSRCETIPDTIEGIHR
jgi:hypothetical protein